MLAARTLLGTRMSCAGGLDADRPGSLIATGVADGLTGAADGLTGAADGLTGAVVGLATGASGFALLERSGLASRISAGGGGGGGGGCDDVVTCGTGSSGLRTSLLARSNPCARMSSTSWVMDIPM